MSAELRDALAAREFVLHYQPKVELATGQVVGCEALLRWQHPQRGLVMPGEFLDAAEASDMILELGEWVLRTGCAQIVAWHDAGAPAVALAVNLSGRQFRDERLPERVASALRDTGLRPPAPTSQACG